MRREQVISMCFSNESNGTYPHIYSFIGDFGAGKTTTLKLIGRKTNYWVGSEFYDYVQNIGKYEAHNTNMTTSKVFEINAFRDKLALNSGAKVAILDQDALSIPAYELARKVHKESSNYDSCVRKLINYRKLNSLTTPTGYVFFKANVKERMHRILFRTKYERPTSEFFTNLITQAAYRSFYESVLEKMDPSCYYVIDTTSATAYEVFEEVMFFIEKFENNHENSQDTSKLVYPSWKTLIKRVLDRYEKDLNFLNISKEIKYG
jgi:broad-specificity NMP kinase